MPSAIQWNIVACRDYGEGYLPGIFLIILKNPTATWVESRPDSDGKLYSDIGISVCSLAVLLMVLQILNYALICNYCKWSIYNKPMFYTKVVDHNGNTILENDNCWNIVIRNSTVFLLTDAMVDVTTDGTEQSWHLSQMK